MYFALSLAFISVVSYLLTKMQFAFADHFYHLGVINGIKRNRMRFLAEHPNFIGERYFVYPQLFHWILSLLPATLYTRRYNIVNFLVSLVSFLIVLALVYLLFWKGTGLTMADLGLFGLAFITTPFFWLPWNAKNLGLSVRTPGTYLGIVFTLFQLHNSLQFSYAVFAILVLLVVVAILMSQFTTQYMLFISVVLSVLFMKVWYLAVPITAFLLMGVLSFGFLRRYMIGQVNHKYIYAKYLAPEYVLSGRYSIWLDFVTGIFKALKHDWKSGLIHAYTNPVILLLWAMPFQTYLLIPGRDAQGLPLQQAVWRFILSAILVFVLFSFRKTRFLGEPERYVEFVVPLPILYVFTLPGFERATAFWLIFYSVACTMAILYIEYRSGSKTKKHVQQRLDALFEGFISKYGDSVSLLSNNWHVMRRFCGTEVRTFTPTFTSLFVGSVPLTVLFKESFIMLDAGCFESVMGFHPMDYCIIDNRAQGAAEWNRKLTGYGFEATHLGDDYTCYVIDATRMNTPVPNTAAASQPSPVRP